MRRVTNLLTAIMVSGALLLATPTTGTKKKKTGRLPVPERADELAKKATSQSRCSPIRDFRADHQSVPADRSDLAPWCDDVVPSSPAVLGRSPTYSDSTLNDNVDGEDLEIRRAAVEALGPYNGSVVVVDPSNGRILTIVNQKLALQGGFIPCSTIKLVSALAAMSEGIMDPHTPLFLSRRVSMDLTEALAHSNNSYFAMLGNKLGFERVSYYAKLYGLGEKAALDLEAEQPGLLPSTDSPGGRRNDDELRLGNSPYSARISGATFGNFQRWNAILSAISAQPGRCSSFSTPG